MSPTGASSQLRSTKGCWTCRLRRKKCDETHPACLICNSLELECQGYGPKPYWMDRGPLERDEAEKVKTRILRRSQKRRRRSGSTGFTKSDHNGGPISQMEFCDSVHPTFPSSNLFTPPYSPNSIASMNLDFFPLPAPIGSFESYTGLEKPENFDFSGSPSSMGSFGMISEIDKSESSEGLFAENILQNAETQSRDQEQRNNFEDSFGIKQHRQPNLPQIVPFSTNTLKAQSIFQDSNFSNPTSIARKESSDDCETGYHFQCSPPSSLHNCSVHDEALITFYLDQLYLLRYPYCDMGSDNTRNRDFLQLFLFRSSITKRSIIALSTAHQVFKQNHTIRSTDEIYEDHVHVARNLFSLAHMPIENLTLLDEADKALRVTEMGICLLHLLLLESFRGIIGNFAAILRNAAPYVQELAYLTSQNRDETRTVEFSSDKRVSEMYSEVSKSLLRSFVWHDILTIVSSTHGFLSLDISHQLLLQKDTLLMEHSIGCENWVLIAICETHNLRQWKREAETSKTLSVLELANRGNVIERRLQEGLEYLREEGNHSQSVKPAEDTKLSSTVVFQMLSVAIQKDVTKIFAQAALLYLHVVLSGPNAQLPEIRRIVSHTLKLFQILGRRIPLFRVLWWPLCLVACFASGDEMPSFEKLMTEVLSYDNMLGIGSKAMQVVKQCWKTRRDGKDCEWAMAIESLRGDVSIC